MAGSETATHAGETATADFGGNRLYLFRRSTWDNTNQHANLLPFIPADKMLGKNVGGHSVGHTVVEYDVVAEVRLQCRNVWGTTSTHDTGRGLVVLVDLQDI